MWSNLYFKVIPDKVDNRFLYFLGSNLPLEYCSSLKVHVSIYLHNNIPSLNISTLNCSSRINFPGIQRLVSHLILS